MKKLAKTIAIILTIALSIVALGIIGHYDAEEEYAEQNLRPKTQIRYYEKM